MKGILKTLRTLSFFYIDIEKEAIADNRFIMGPNYSAINMKITSKLKKKFPDQFEHFSNEYRGKDKEFFLKKGFKYRILIYSTFRFVEYNKNNLMTGQIQTQTTTKQNYCIVVQDMETEKIYGQEKWYWYYNYINKFIKIVAN